MSERARFNGHASASSSPLVPGKLLAQLHVGELPAVMVPGQEVRVRAIARNTGDSTWLAAPGELGGYVTFGIKLCRVDGRILNDALGRTRLEHDVVPGHEIAVVASFRIPVTLAPGRYELRFDMVDELIAWFEQYGSPVVARNFMVDDVATRTAARPSLADHADPYGPLVESAGAALAGMGVINPSLDILEPIARTIHSLVPSEGRAR